VGSKKSYNTMVAHPKVGGLPRKVVPVGAPDRGGKILAGAKTAHFWGVFDGAKNRPKKALLNIITFAVARHG
jgi:hypothetical protein